jgi:hypothetical protein
VAGGDDTTTPPRQTTLALLDVFCPKLCAFCTFGKLEKYGIVHICKLFRVNTAPFVKLNEVSRSSKRTQFGA